MNFSFAGIAAKSVSVTKLAAISTSKATTPTKIKVTYKVSSCTATGSIGVGANKIELSATAPTCKEAIAMIKAAFE